MTVADFDPAERFVAGTVGPPGSRTFFLQARGRGHVVSVSLEKLQVSMLGERIGDLLDRVGEDGSVGRPDNDPLDTPIEDEFRVNAIGLAWDTERSLIVIECHDHDPDEGSPKTARHCTRCACPCSPTRRVSSPAGRARSSLPVDRPAPSVVRRWTRAATSAPGPTAIAGERGPRPARPR